MITIQRAITSDGKYPDRESSPELTLEVRTNLGKTVEAVNKLLAELGIKDVIINSGFRTVKANIDAGGSKFSAHCTGQSLDLQDKSGDLYRLISVNVPLLKKYALYMESNPPTINWVHLSIRRPASGNNIFKP